MIFVFVQIQDFRVAASCAVASRYNTIFFCGGYPNGAAVASAGVMSYDGRNWSELAPMKRERARAAAVFAQGRHWIGFGFMCLVYFACLKHCN